MLPVHTRIKSRKAFGSMVDFLKMCRTGLSHNFRIGSMSGKNIIYIMCLL